MAGEGRVNGDMCRLGIAHFADHDDIGVLSNKGAKRSREGQADLGLDLGLINAGNLIFDGIFDRQNFARGIVECGQHGREGRGFAAPRRAGKDNDAMRQRQQTYEVFLDQSETVRVL